MMVSYDTPKMGVFYLDIISTIRLYYFTHWENTFTHLWKISLFFIYIFEGRYQSVLDYTVSRNKLLIKEEEKL